MKIIDQLTKRLDHMVPDKGLLNRNKRATEAYLKEIAKEEARLNKIAEKNK